MRIPSIRLTYGLVAIASCCLMITALVMQEFLGMHPCPLCITQRGFIMLTGVIALAACLHNPVKTGRYIYAVLMILAAGAGAGVAGRHVWIQNLPEDQVPSCGPGLEYMFSNFPFMQALELLFMGDGNCADVVWTFLGLSIPGWTLVWFVVFIAIGLFQIFRKGAPALVPQS